MRLSNLTWPKAEEYFRAHDTVLIGIGSIECHGRHMPLGTDTLIPDFLLDKIEQKSDVLICPTIPYGATESLCDYPGTINLGTELLYQVLGRVCDSLFQHGARRFVILNGHGGNIKSIDRVGYDIQRKGGILAELNWWLMAWDMDPAWKGGHGGGEETAAILGDGGGDEDALFDGQLHELASDDGGAGRYAELQGFDLVIGEAVEGFDVFAAGVDDGADETQNGVGDDVAGGDDGAWSVFAEDLEHLGAVDFGDGGGHAVGFGVHADEDVFLVDAGEGDETVVAGDAFFLEAAIVGAVGEDDFDVWMELGE